MKHPIIPVNEIPDHGTRVVEFFGREVHVYKAKGKPVAVANTCLHFGGPLECQDGKFVCQWHGAEFSAEDGQRLKGPASRSSRLMFLSTTIEDDMLTYVWGE